MWQMVLTEAASLCDFPTPAHKKESRKFCVRSRRRCEKSSRNFFPYLCSEHASLSWTIRWSCSSRCCSSIKATARSRWDTGALICPEFSTHLYHPLSFLSSIFFARFKAFQRSPSLHARALATPRHLTTMICCLGILKTA